MVPYSKVERTKEKYAVLRVDGGYDEGSVSWSRALY